MTWFEDGQQLFRLFDGLLGESEQLRARAEASEHECEKLRQENQAIRAERDEIVGDLGRLLTELLQPMNAMVQKIRGAPKKSPFERESNPAPLNEPTRAAPSGVTRP